VDPKTWTDCVRRQYEEQSMSMIAQIKSGWIISNNKGTEVCNKDRTPGDAAQENLKSSKMTDQ